MGIMFRVFPTLWLLSINTLSSWPPSHPPPQLLRRSPQVPGFQHRVCFSSIAPEECLVVLCVTLGECLIMLSVTRCGCVWAERRRSLIPLCFVLRCTALVCAEHFTLALWRNSCSCCTETTSPTVTLCDISSGHCSLVWVNRTSNTAVNTQWSSDPNYLYLCG